MLVDKFIENIAIPYNNDLHVAWPLAAKQLVIDRYYYDGKVEDSVVRYLFQLIEAHQVNPNAFNGFLPYLVNNKNISDETRIASTKIGDERFFSVLMNNMSLSSNVLREIIKNASSSCVKEYANFRLSMIKKNVMESFCEE